jgi:predicted nucleic acid-binding protein
MNRSVARRAARLRPDHNVKPVDALQIATALEAGGTLLITKDQGLRKLAPHIEIAILKDFIES